MNLNAVPSMQGRSILSRDVVLEIDRIILQGTCATPHQAERIRQEIKKEVERRLEIDSNWRPRPVSDRISLVLESADAGEDELARAVARQIIQALEM